MPIDLIEYAALDLLIGRIILQQRKNGFEGKVSSLCCLLLSFLMIARHSFQISYSIHLIGGCERDFFYYHFGSYLL